MLKWWVKRAPVALVSFMLVKSAAKHVKVLAYLPVPKHWSDCVQGDLIVCSSPYEFVIHDVVGRFSAGRMSFCLEMFAGGRILMITLLEIGLFLLNVFHWISGASEYRGCLIVTCSRYQSIPLLQNARKFWREFSFVIPLTFSVLSQHLALKISLIVLEIDQDWWCVV